MSTSAEDHRARSRRRGAQLEEAILAAALAELQESGYAALSMEAIARRAGTGKASLYRRWDSRAALMVDAVHALAPRPADIPDTGTLRTDLLEVLRRTAEVLAGPAGEALRGLLAEALPDARRLAELRGRSRGSTRQLMRQVVERAAARGEIPAGAVRPSRMDVGAAMLRSRVLVDAEEPDEQMIVEIVDEILLPMLRALPEPPAPSL